MKTNPKIFLTFFGAGVSILAAVIKIRKCTTHRTATKCQHRQEKEEEQDHKTKTKVSQVANFVSPVPTVFVNNAEDFAVEKATRINEVFDHRVIQGKAPTSWARHDLESVAMARGLHELKETHTFILCQNYAFRILCRISFNIAESMFRSLARDRSQSVCEQPSEILQFRFEQPMEAAYRGSTEKLMVIQVSPLGSKSVMVRAIYTFGSSKLLSCEKSIDLDSWQVSLSSAVNHRIEDQARDPLGETNVDFSEKDDAAQLEPFSHHEKPAVGNNLLSCTRSTSCRRLRLAVAKPSKRGRHGRPYLKKITALNEARIPSTQNVKLGNLVAARHSNCFGKINCQGLQPEPSCQVREFINEVNHCIRSKWQHQAAPPSTLSKLDAMERDLAVMDFFIDLIDSGYVNGYKFDGCGAASRRRPRCIPQPVLQFIHSFQKVIREKWERYEIRNHDKQNKLEEISRDAAILDFFRDLVRDV